MAYIISFLFGFGAGIAVVLFFVRTGKTFSFGLIERQKRVKEERKRTIVESLKNRKRITNNDVEKMLGVSDATAERYLQGLEHEGYIRQIGARGGYVYYEKRDGSTR
jgi:predicted HTH transcriptional regulator